MHKTFSRANLFWAVTVNLSVTNQRTFAVLALEKLEPENLSSHLKDGFVKFLKFCVMTNFFCDTNILIAVILFPESQAQTG